MGEPGAVAPERIVLLDFDQPADLGQWSPIDDVVMGGVSRSSFTLARHGIASFAGVVSLDNGGGFASVRTMPRDWDTARATAFLLHVLGDGRTYKLTVRSDDGFDGVQYQCRFTPPAGEWADMRLPIESFAATFRGRNVPGAAALDPSRIRALGFMISDKQAGRFELLVDSIAIEAGR
jgi:NADH dehydrogenase [ubiquinone] 1 alpha subcomplex assembly factor 1